MKNNIKSIQQYKETKEEKSASILLTYSKLINGVSLYELNSIDIQNIQNFYSYLTLEGAKDMFNEEATALAYEEMKNYVGNYSYSIEIKKVFLQTYLEFIKSDLVQTKTINDEEEMHFLKMA